MVNRNAALVDVGKRFGTKFHTQSEINELLIAYSARYETVVRLKGGDPSLFGRAGEEIETLTCAGVDFEVVPRITAAMAGAAAARISLTDRRHAASVTFVTAQRCAAAGETHWSKLVAIGSTLAIYMPGTRYQELCDCLRDAGLDAKTPCAVVSAASRRDQQVLWTDLRSLRDHSALPAPSILIVGECARAVARTGIDLDAYAHVFAPPAQEHGRRSVEDKGI